MSRAAQDWAAQQTKLDPAIRWTLWLLADYAHADGSAAFPGVPLLAKLAGVTERTIQRHLRDLELFRYIERGDDALVAHYRADRRPAVWNLRMNPGQSIGIFVPNPGDPAMPTPPVDAVDRPGDNHPNGVTQLSPQRGDTQRPNGVTYVSPNPRTKRELTRARARGDIRQPCSPQCEDPRVGAGRGWLADGPAGEPRPCPVCRLHRPRVRWG